MWPGPPSRPNGSPGSRTGASSTASGTASATARPTSCSSPRRRWRSWRPWCRLPASTSPAITGSSVRARARGIGSCRPLPRRSRGRVRRLAALALRYRRASRSRIGERPAGRSRICAPIRSRAAPPDPARRSALRPPRLRRGPTERDPARDAWPGPSSCGACSPPMCCSVRNARQTTYRFDDRPSQVRITYRPHPLFGRTLKVVAARRRGREIWWVVELPDASRNRVPSCWTDTVVGPVDPPATRGGVRATPRVLRQLADLLEVLARSATRADPSSDRTAKGGPHEPNTPALRSDGEGLD